MSGAVLGVTLEPVQVAPAETVEVTCESRDWPSAGLNSGRPPMPPKMLCVVWHAATSSVLNGAVDNSEEEMLAVCFEQESTLAQLVDVLKELSCPRA